MLVGVVEDDDLALAPDVILAGNAQCAVARHDQRQVGDEPRVRDAAMRQQMRAGGEDREQYLGAVLADPRQRQSVERSRRSGAGVAVVLAPLTVPEKIIAIPARSRVLATQVLRFQFVGIEHALARGGSWQQRLQLLADRIGLFLERIDPAKQRSIEIGRRRHVRYVEKRRLLARVLVLRRVFTEVDPQAALDAAQRLRAVLRRERLKQ